MDARTIEDFIHAKPLFRNAEPDLFEQLARHGTLVEWKRLQSIDNDDGIEYLNIILEGKVKLTQIDPVSARSITLFILEGGDLFDLLAFLDGRKHLSFPVALEKTTALRVDMDHAREWLRRYPRFNAAFLPYVGEQMRRIERFAESVVFDDTVTRLARLILDHTSDKKPAEHDLYPVKLINDLSHEVLAEMVGTVRSVVTSQLKKLKEEGLIVREKEGLAVKKMEELIRRYGL